MKLDELLKLAVASIAEAAEGKNDFALFYEAGRVSAYADIYERADRESA